MASLKNLAKMEMKMPARKRGAVAFKPVAPDAQATTGAAAGAGQSAAPSSKPPGSRRQLRTPRLSAPSIARRGGELRGLSGGQRTVVGLDVQPGYVAAVQTRGQGQPLVQRAAGRALPPETVREGEILDESLLTEALKELFSDGKLPRRVRLGIANQRTVLRVIELPPIDDRKALEAAVRFQAQDHMPMPLANASLDFQPLGIVETPAGPRQRVVVVAAQKDMVSRLYNAVTAAGLRPVGVDLSAFAMIRALYRRGEGDGSTDAAAEQDDAAAAASTLYLNVGGLTNLAIAEGLACRFTRMVSGGLESMASELAERHSIALVEARRLLGEANLLAPPPPPVAAEPLHEPELADTAVVAPGPEAEAEGQAESHLEVVEDLHGTQLSEEPGSEDPAVAEARTVLGAGLRDIAGEVRNSLDFHRSQGGGEVREVVISGAALEIDGFVGALESELGFPLVRRGVEVDGGQQLGGVSAERLAIAAGLAVEEVAP
jgi:type IV pilus assembly protein PilM